MYSFLDEKVLAPGRRPTDRQTDRPKLWVPCLLSKPRNPKTVNAELYAIKNAYRVEIPLLLLAKASYVIYGCP